MLQFTSAKKKKRILGNSVTHSCRQLEYNMSLTKQDRGKTQ